jgi:hypothetical protein
MPAPRSLSAHPARWLEPLAFIACAVPTLSCLFYKLGSIPAGLQLDETMIGYDASSLGKTGADHFGRRLPLFFESVGDYKSPVYIYLAAINEKVLGPTPFALRLTSVELALVFSLSIFFLLRALTSDSRFARWMALFSLLVPSVFLFARMSTAENMSLLALTALALNPLLLFEKEPSWGSATLAGAALGLCTYTYHVGRFLAPAMVAVAAISYAFDGRTRRFLPAFLASAALVALPVAAFMWLHPNTLTRRFQSLGLWHDHPTFVVALERFVQTYAQHLLSLDFLFRSGQQQLTVNTGTGLVPLWLWPTVLVGLASLWMRRTSPFARFVLAMLFVSPIPVALTWENLPHTGRIFHLIVFAFVTGALGVFDLLSRGGTPRWLPALLAAGVLLEGAQDVQFYFGPYAALVDRLRPLEDLWRGDALQIAFAARRGEEPLYLANHFFDFDSSYLQFYGDLDPVRRRTEGLEQLGIFDASETIDLTSGGILVVEARNEPLEEGILLGTTPPPGKGQPVWAVYRLREQ